MGEVQGRGDIVVSGGRYRGEWERTAEVRQSNWYKPKSRAAGLTRNEGQISAKR